MDQAEKAQAFAALHIPGKPVILYNIWDAAAALTERFNERTGMGPQ